MPHIWATLIARNCIYMFVFFLSFNNVWLLGYIFVRWTVADFSLSTSWRGHSSTRVNRLTRTMYVHIRNRHRYLLHIFIVDHQLKHHQRIVFSIIECTLVWLCIYGTIVKISTEMRTGTIPQKNVRSVRDLQF